MSNEFVRINIKMPKKMHERYKAKSERTGVPMTSLMYLDLEKIHEQEDSIKTMSNIEELAKAIKAKEDK